MTPSRTGLTRLFPAAALVAALGLPMTACAQDQVVEETADAPAVAQAEETKPAEPVEKAEEPKEKTAEELKKEAEEKEIKQIQHEAKLRAARLSAELAPLKEEKQKIEAELALLQAKQQDAHAKAKLEKQQADFLASLRLAEMNREMQAMQAQMQAMQTKLQIDGLKAQAKTAELTAQTTALKAELALLDAQRGTASVDKDAMQYPTEPLKDGVLAISDRRIPLNGMIGRGSADFVTERIHYFNNLDEKAPIFIVIDSNPGGSVMEGYRIVTAMQNSKAPVHVVVKSYAASMAAVITTLAEESYAYPNAIILHHQMSSGMRGNLTQQKEQLEEGFEWEKRLADPVAEKMGVTYDEFTELMYKNNSDGDWAEFADKAKELKWVNNVVE
ncbi:MAG: ATP-dependent Clp protease proteolytic subunit, partial [Planctomycetota bacterium]